ncbi:hypothetical protein [Tetragenococcus halophilus]|uniref:hypothetical protein n=1 Tax=Tetragenococcus halophilus TaxID=51669 RepID=UPI00077C304E|nr:hypothetical protein [Tetragenococcus halophilus]
MKDINQIKRKHSRFPAFSDETGVKLQSEKNHPSFSNDEPWILTEDNDAPLTKTLLKQNKKKRGIRRSKKVSQEKTGLTKYEENELKEHKKHLPDYSAKHNSSFGSTYTHATAKNESPTDSLQRKNNRRSYFASKYVPATEANNKNEHKKSEKELLNSLKKSQEDYLMFETDDTNLKSKDNSDVRIHKYDQNELSNREQTKAKNKKAGILNRSLKGMIEEDTNDLKENGYFEKGK